MKTIFLLSTLILHTVFLFAQNAEYKIRTEISTKDSLIYLIQELIDTNLVKSYNCTFGDSIDHSSHIGFLWHKKNYFREYKIDKKWNEVLYDVPCLNIRICIERNPIIIKRLN